MPGSIAEVNFLQNAAESSGPTSESFKASNITEPNVLSSTPGTKARVAYVELRSLTEEERSQYSSDISERPITYEEAFPEQEMLSIVGEVQMYYFVKLSDGQAFRASCAHNLSCILLTRLLCSFQLKSLPVGILDWLQNTVCSL